MSDLPGPDKSFFVNLVQHILAFALGPHHSRHTQHPEVLGRYGLLHAEQRVNVLNICARVVEQECNNPQTQRMCQRAQDCGRYQQLLLVQRYSGCFGHTTWLFRSGCSSFGGQGMLHLHRQRTQANMQFFWHKKQGWGNKYTACNGKPGCMQQVRKQNQEIRGNGQIASSSTSREIWVSRSLSRA